MMENVLQRPQLRVCVRRPGRDTPAHVSYSLQWTGSMASEAQFFLDITWAKWF